ncbi:hypothetical protein [Aequorivita sp. KMM 9714]|uniref:hypothetical protein n=1 Tax=Aequorivita sp. KMM 9714 TaxID=2707173 RepID=UPI0013EB0CA9|nr:hypothetical protein [Aequorivita sp. KMM 9714]NGX85380.1 hypothetical protein [Aequorivita sp. KMM 9714]
MLNKINIKESVNLYRNHINHKEHSVDDYINLILLLWNVSFDYGFESYCIAQNVFTQEEILKFPEDTKKLFNDAFQEYPNNNELLFWKIYTDDLSAYSEGVHKEDICDLLNGDNFLLPYFYFYVQCENLNTKRLSELKRSLINEKDSYKKYYILSYLSDINLT